MDEPCPPPFDDEDGPGLSLTGDDDSIVPGEAEFRAPEAPTVSLAYEGREG